MEKEILKQIIDQIKRYDLAESFSDVEQLKTWISKLNSTQINNFLGLNIALEEIKDLKYVLIDSELLNCKDYEQRVAAISTLKNSSGSCHLFDLLCNPNFLKIKNFYKDIEMLSRDDNGSDVLRILRVDVFINSPYHDEDLKLIIETRDANKENPLYFVVTQALTSVASNIDSIKSPYHQDDMKLIARVGNYCLQMQYPFQKRRINNLAVNRISLSDKYHLENMEILAKNPIASEFLYIVMTDPEIIKGKDYRKEVEALLNAKSKLTARALYYYIANPEKKFNSLFDDYKYDMVDAWFAYVEYVSGKTDPNYTNNLIRINQIDDKFVMHYVSLLMNPNFINSPYKKFDLELLETVSSKPIFMDLYRLMSDETSLSSSHHKKDAIIISQTESDGRRDLLLEKAVDEYSLKSNNHEYDMEYISGLNLDSIKEKIYFEMYYYLFDQKGIDDSHHKEKLEKLLQGILVERNTSISSYLESQMENREGDSHQIIESVQNASHEQGPKVLNLIKKYIKKPRCFKDS